MEIGILLGKSFQQALDACLGGSIDKVTRSSPIAGHRSNADQAQGPAGGMFAQQSEHPKRYASEIDVDNVARGHGVFFSFRLTPEDTIGDDDFIESAEPRFQRVDRRSRWRRPRRSEVTLSAVAAPLASRSFPTLTKRSGWRPSRTKFAFSAARRRAYA